LSLRTRFIVYLLVVHALLAAAGIYVFRENRLWLFAVEAVFVASLAIGVVLVRRMFRALAFVAESAQFLNDSDYTTRFLEVGQAEIDRLIAVYNRMVDSLRAERQRVQEQHYFLGKVLDVSPSGILVLDFDGRIDLVNPAAERLLQRPADRLRGTTLAGSGVPILEPLVSLGSGQGRVTATQGGRRVRAQRGTFLDRGFPRSFFLLEELTEELRQSERAAYEKLIRMMSHEVNNSVGASSSLLHSSLAYGSQLSAADRADFERALQIAIDRMGQLNLFMRSFADVVRLPQPARQAVNVVDVLRRIEGLVHTVREKRGIAWAWDIEEDDAVAAMDAVQMEQALLNIVKNAMEAIDETAGDPRAWRAASAAHDARTWGAASAAHDAESVDGDAQSTAARRTRGTVTVRLRRANGRLRLTIEDTGSGIRPDARDQLFTPFFTTKPHGQGIGLTMVQEILSNHGFEFSLDSAADGPTRFTIDM
jgi:nitrogen fixation/metabolism regulation signal transduction histidine kinase